MSILNNSTATATFDIAPPSSDSVLSGSRTTIVTGWWHPLTLSLNDRWWSADTVTSLRTPTTTTSLIMVVQRFSTDFSATYSWTDQSVTANNWWFVAVAWQNNGTNIGSARIWLGTPNTPPVLGNATGSFGSGTITNSGTFQLGLTGSSNNFDGYISNVVHLNLPGTGGSSELDSTLIRERYVNPLWRGDFDVQQLLSNSSPNVPLTPANSDAYMTYIPCDEFDSSNIPFMYQYSNSFNGTTVNAIRRLGNQAGGPPSLFEPPTQRLRFPLTRSAQLCPTSRR